MTDLLEQVSAALADRAAAVAPCAVAIGTGRSHVSGILWRPDVVVTSAQELPDRSDFNLRRAGTQFTARLAGRDPGTNVALLRLAQPIEATLPPRAATPPRVASLALLVGADDTGAPTGRLAMVHATGPEWHSQAGGKSTPYCGSTCGSAPMRAGRCWTPAAACSACPPPGRAAAPW